MAVRAGGTGADVFDASALGEFNESNQYTGLAGDDTLTGGGLKDRLVGGDGSDVLSGDDGADTLLDRDEAGNDRLDGGEGDDTIESRYGSDTLIGGTGHDTVTFGFGSMLVSGGQGDDVFISIGQGPASATITGGAGDDVLQAGASADSFDGGQGEDLVDYSAVRRGIVLNFQTGVSGGGAVGDTFRLVEDVIGTEFADVIVGNGFSNVLFGSEGDDTIGGGLGGDYLDGGDGFDIADLAAGGSTRVMGDLSTLVFTGGGADGDVFLNFEGLSGSSFDDVLTGDNSANLLIGRDGIDTLDGGAGADTLDGGNGIDSLIGGDGFDNLLGGEGADFLDGGLGQDRLEGGVGNDLYVVDSLSDSILETSSGGVDTVTATISYTLDSIFLENLILFGSSAISGYGNDRANRITGNEFDNILDGGAAADTLVGGDGSDTYYLDAPNDRVQAGGTGDFDQIFTTANYTSSSFGIENVTALGDADLSIYIAGLSGEAFGNEGDNFFEIVSGSASLSGGDGADTYYFVKYRIPAMKLEDFNVGEDFIQLDGPRRGLSPGPLSANRLAISSDDEITDATRLIYDDVTGQLFSDRDGSRSTFSPILLTTLDPGLNLATDNFIII